MRYPPLEQCQRKSEKPIALSESPAPCAAWNSCPYYVLFMFCCATGFARSGSRQSCDQARFLPGAHRMTADVETIVVGAGVVGLAVARALAEAGHGVMVLEQHALIGSETSSRNSEVIHAGIYYPPGSLRATLCVRGKELLYRFCAENNVPHARCGKLLVATHESQLPKLAAIRETAAKNGVTDLEPIGGNAARDLEPELACVAALISPSTGIVDSHGLMLALEGHIEAHGGSVVLRCPVERIERTPQGHFRLVTGGDAPGAITCANRLCAGLHGSKLAVTLDHGDTYRPPETYYAKGQYYALSGRSPFKRHIYPLPTAPGSACTPRSTSAGAASSAPTSNGSRVSTTASCPRSSTSSWILSAATIRGSTSRACTPTTRASAQALSRGRAGAGFCHPRRRQARAAGTGRPLWHREPGSHRLAGDRRDGGGDAEPPRRSSPPDPPPAPPLERERGQSTHKIAQLVAPAAPRTKICVRSRDQ